MSWAVLEGDCREVLRGMADGCVQTCVTSPPYFGLRDYGHGEQIGLEPTPDEFVQALVAVFREVRRVLRDDGTVWLNLGDSYSGSGPSGASYESETTKRRAEGDGTDGNFRISKTLGKRGLTYAEKKPIPAAGTKPKDLIGIPWMVAFALRADGWYLRSDIIWAKPNPMPESVTDRPTKAHEYVFLLSKSPRYYYDADAIREDAIGKNDHDLTGPPRVGVPGQPDHRGGRAQTRRAQELVEQHGLTDAHLAAIRAVGITDVGKAQVTQDGFGKNDPAIQALADEAKAVLGGYYREFLLPPSGRNKRSVWTVATQPYAEAHFATFPPKLVEPCVLAGCPERACGACGEPWRRVTEVERELDPTAGANAMRGAGHFRDSPGGPALREGRSFQRVSERRTLGFEPACACGVDPVPGTVLDPFAGAGTTGLVAVRNKRAFIGVELNPEYAQMARDRIALDVRLGHRPPERGREVVEDQESLFA